MGKLLEITNVLEQSKKARRADVQTLLDQCMDAQPAKTREK